MSQYQNITVLTGTRQQITNNAFSFSAGHPFLQLIMRGVERSYRPGCWACIGPEIFTKSLKEYDNTLRKDVAVVDMKRSYRSFDFGSIKIIQDSGNTLVYVQKTDRFTHSHQETVWALSHIRDPSYKTRPTVQ